MADDVLALMNAMTLPTLKSATAVGHEFRTSWLAAVLAIAATYFYFLIFAEFAFLELARAVDPASRAQRLLMLGLGVGGVSGAGLGAWSFRASRGPVLLAWTMRACALGAAGALAAKTFALLCVAGVAVGLSLGALTVVLAASLRGATSGRNLGLAVGAGTGLAYAFCNLPWLFWASATIQTALAAGVVLMASFLPRLLATRTDDAPRSNDTSRRNLVWWLAVLLALVWMDSAAFYIVQHTASLRAASWGGTPALVANAFVHFGAAVVAGAVLDRGWRGVVAGAALAALAIACLMLNGAVPAFLPAGWFYTAGVSLYSVALVEYPARSGRAWIAAVVFAVAGWLGSAFGIGMAQDLARVPTEFVGLAVVAVAVALLARGRVRVASRIVVVAACVAVATVRADEIALGREVYIAEGCIHCHSQYIRSRSATDVELWGPSTPLRHALAAAPPLFGTRRQGPDLAQVGNRRSPEWNRLHLIAPQSISPGSRMPSYAHLFAAGDSRGAELVAYLASLGAENFERRRVQMTAWAPNTHDAIAPAKARELFVRLCSACHGESGRGDGKLAARLSLRPPDWVEAPWRHVPPGAPVEETLSRIIKFGVPGLPMAGHEYLPDAEIVGLARFVQSLHKAGGGTSAVVQP